MLRCATAQCSTRSAIGSRTSSSHSREKHVSRRRRSRARSGEIRLALLEADVNFKVVKAFVDRVRDRAMDQAVQKSLTPSQQVVKIVRDELLALFGDAKGGLQETSARPRVILMLGLQGSGKTTTTGKLAKWLAKQGRHPIVVSTDVRRPAAIQQLAIVARAGRRAGARPGRRDGSGRARQGRAGRSPGSRQRRRHRRHGGPAAHRRRADERARRDQGRRRDRRICSTSRTR